MVSLDSPEPSVVDLVRSGLEALRSNRLDEAESFRVRAARRDPKAVEPLNLGGVIALARGDFADASRLLGKAARAAPDRADLHVHHGEALERASRPKEAITAYETALSLAPDLVNANARLAKLQADHGDPRRALAFARIALAFAPESIEALCARAQAHRRLNQTAEADACYRQALELTPRDPRVLTAYATLLVKLQLPAEAAALYRRAAQDDPGNAQLLASLGTTAELSGDIQGAVQVYEDALRAAPSDPEIIYRRACCIRDLGQFEAAERAFGEALALDPDHGSSFMALARMRRLKDDPDVRNRLTRVISDRSRRTDHRVQAAFAFGELLDRAGESDAAFHRFAEANRLWREDRASRGERFDPEDLRSQTAHIEQSLAAEYARDTAQWGTPSELPVFVVGLPRSGTTLVEQICASHSCVAGVGEMEGMIPITRAIAQRNATTTRLADWDGAHARSLADGYVAELGRRGGDARRVVNKTPLNLLRLGPIGALFPKGRVIWCRRDLRDIVTSQHTMFFGDGNLYSTDLADCAFAARQIERIGAAWRSAAQIPILEIVYEDLVADLETHVRRIIDFLDLEWESACLDFQNTNRHVDTPSSWQVRQPIYSSSVGRWRRFEKHLGPMFATLAQPIDELPQTRRST